MQAMVSDFESNARFVNIPDIWYYSCSVVVPLSWYDHDSMAVSSVPPHKPSSLNSSAHSFTTLT
jgi:hypothetical protein